MKKVFALLITLAMILPLCFVGTSAEDINVLYVSPEELAAAGYASVKDYHSARAGKFHYKDQSGWGRAGYKSIQGMASLCDGEKNMPALTAESEEVKDTSILYWKIKDVEARFDADGIQGDGEKYISLVGYEFQDNWTFNVTDFTIYLDGNETTKNIDGFDILGGYFDANDDLQWEVLWSGENLLTENKYLTENESTVYIDGTFEKAFEGQYIQIGITSLLDPTKTVFYITEFELNGEVYEKAPETTLAPADDTSAAPADDTSAAPADDTSAAPADDTSAAPADDTSAAPADDTSAAPADDTTAAPAADTTAAAKDKGCGGSVAGSIVGVIAVVSLGITAIRKKND
ncbi:MAG: hypothetical protein MJ102_02335 [Clostridia bacterium]|nr:hypothetical protein [Clostridia bacterium]